MRGFYNPSNKTILIEENTFKISFEGFHNASNFLFAYTVAKELGIGFASFNKFDFVSLGGRNKIIKSVKTTHPSLDLKNLNLKAKDLVLFL